MNKALLITYEPALFLLAALGWAGWEFWSMRSKKVDKPPAQAEGVADATSPSAPPGEGRDPD